MNQLICNGKAYTKDINNNSEETERYRVLATMGSAKKVIWKFLGRLCSPSYFISVW